MPVNLISISPIIAYVFDFRIREPIKRVPPVPDGCFRALSCIALDAIGDRSVGAVLIPEMPIRRADSS